MTRARTRVFVYGTLLRGEANHRLLAASRFVGPTETMPGFELRDLGAFPGLVAGGDSAVAGEVYEVDPTTLAALDRLEGHPTFYRRSPIDLADGSIAEAYMLRSDQVERRPIIVSGSWRHRAEVRL